MNDELHIKLRKTENGLITGGLVVILFGVWNVIRIFLFCFMDNVQKRTIIESTELLTEFPWLMYIVLGILALFDLLLRWYVGRRAILEGRYGKEKKFYLVWLIFMIVIGYLLESSNLKQAVGVRGNDWEDAVVAAIVDGTSLLIMIQVLLSSLEVKRLRRKIREEWGE